MAILHQVHTAVWCAAAGCSVVVAQHNSSNKEEEEERATASVLVVVVVAGRGGVSNRHKAEHQITPTQEPWQHFYHT